MQITFPQEFILTYFLQTIKNEVNSIESDLCKLDGLAVLLMNKEGIENARNTEKEMEELRRYMKAVEDRVIQFRLTKAVCKNYRFYNDVHSAIFMTLCFSKCIYNKSQ